MWHVTVTRKPFSCHMRFHLQVIQGSDLDIFWAIAQHTTGGIEMFHSLKNIKNIYVELIWRMKIVILVLHKGYINHNRIPTNLWSLVF